VDYFYANQYYGSLSSLEECLAEQHLACFQIKPLQQVMNIPLPLRHPNMLGKVGLGKKGVSYHDK
jgi:hypothetical protein